MKRYCQHIISSPNRNISIYIDVINKNEILEYLKKDDRHKKKFKFISDIILGGHKNPEVYDKENINENCENVTAIKFFKGQENDRIYCQENSDEGETKIILSELHLKKKNQKNSHREINCITKVASYEYEIQR